MIVSDGLSQAIGSFMALAPASDGWVREPLYKNHTTEVEPDPFDPMRSKNWALLPQLAWIFGSLSGCPNISHRPTFQISNLNSQLSNLNSTLYLLNLSHAYHR